MYRLFDNTFHFDRHDGCDKNKTKIYREKKCDSAKYRHWMTTKSTFCYTKEDINDVTSFQKKRNKCLYAVESKKGVFNVFLVYAVAKKKSKCSLRITNIWFWAMKKKWYDIIERNLKKLIKWHVFDFAFVFYVFFSPWKQKSAF